MPPNIVAMKHPPTTYMNTNTSLEVRKNVEELVREWNLAVHLLRTGLETLGQAEAHFRAFDGPGSHFDLCLFTHSDYTLDFGRKIKRLKAAAWRYLVALRRPTPCGPPSPAIRARSPGSPPIHLDQTKRYNG